MCWLACSVHTILSCHLNSVQTSRRHRSSLICRGRKWGCSYCYPPYTMQLVCGGAQLMTHNKDPENGPQIYLILKPKSSSPVLFCRLVVRRAWQVLKSCAWLTWCTMPVVFNIADNKNEFLSCCCLLKPRDVFPTECICFPRSTKLPSKGHVVFLFLLFWMYLKIFLFWSIPNQFWIKI